MSDVKDTRTSRAHVSPDRCRNDASDECEEKKLRRVQSCVDGLLRHILIGRECVRRCDPEDQGRTGEHGEDNIDDCAE
jgi:hypothetical protein